MIRNLIAACQGVNPHLSNVQQVLSKLTIADCGKLCDLTQLEHRMKCETYDLAPHIIDCKNPRHVQERFGSMRQVGCANFFHSASVDVSVFIIPPNCRLPLHDHPSLTVAQKFLFGQSRVIAFDWINNGGKASVVFSGEKCADGGVDLILPAKGGVLHEIWNERQVPVVFIDVIMPPYHQPPFFSECTYYSAGEVELSQLVCGAEVHLEPFHVQPFVDMITFVPVS